MLSPLAPDFHDHRAGQLVEQHLHDEGQVLLAAEGRMDVRAGAERLRLAPRNAVWIPPRLLHAARSLELTAFRGVMVSLPRLQGLPGVAACFAASPMFIAAALELADARAGRRALASSVLLDALRSALAPQLGPALPADPRLAGLCQRVQEDCENPPSLDQAAAAAGFSRRSFTRSFRKATGRSWSEWVREARLAKAASLLGAGARVTDAALAVGYANPSAFSVAFRRSNGQPPVALTLPRAGLDAALHKTSVILEPGEGTKAGMKRFFVSSLFALAVTALVAGCSKEQDQTVIGLAGPLTGFNAVYGEQTRRGAEMAVADINAAGGVLGKKLKLKLGDDQCDPKQAVAVANDMVSAKVPFVLGHFCSGSAIPAADVYAEVGTIAISTAATNPKLTEDPNRKNIFRICGRDDQQGGVAGAFLAKQFGRQKIAIAHDRTSYTQGLAEEARKALNAAGVREAMFDTITPGEKDYSAFITKLKQAGIEVLYFGGYPAESILLARQLREQGLQTVFVSGDGLATTEFWNSVGPGAEGALFTFGPDVASDPKNAAVVERFRAKGESAEGYTLYAYAAIQAWAQAATKAGSIDPAKVAVSLRQNQLDTVMGQVSFDDKGDVKAPGYVIYRWSQGKFAPLPG